MATASWDSCRRLTLAALAIGLALGGSAGAEDESQVEIIRRLVRDLDDDQFKVRRLADLRLREMGRVTWAPLVAAYPTGSPEMQFRIRGILDHFERRRLVGEWQLIRWEKNGKSETGPTAKTQPG